MAISSGASPMAYVLSDIRDINSINNDCTGQNLFKFDPTTINPHLSAWTKKTIGIDLYNCGHLGLAFGWGESVFYAFSIFNSLSTVNLFETSGNSIW